MPAAGRTENHSALASVLQWWAGTRERWARMAELRDLPPGEIDRVAADFGVSSADLLAASGRSDGTLVLLDQRLAGLGIEKEEIAVLLPMLLRDLQRTCAACPDKRRCEDDMEVSPVAPGWESYCPNSGTLRTLR